MNNTDGVNNSAEPGMSDALDVAHDAPEVSTPTGDLVPVTTPGEIATTETAETQHSESGKQPAKQPKQPKKASSDRAGFFRRRNLARVDRWVPLVNSAADIHPAKSTIR